jgi:hypothetical protein
MGDDFFADLTPVRKPRSVMGDLSEDEEERLRRQGSPGAAVTAGGPGFVAVEPDVAPTRVDFGDYVANRLKLGFSNLATLLSSSEAEKQVLRGGQPYFGFEPATQPDLVTRMFGAGVEAVPMVALPVPLRGASLFARGRTGAVTGAFGAGAIGEFAGGIGQEVAGAPGRIAGELVGGVTGGTSGQILGDLVSGKLISIGSNLYRSMLKDVSDAVGPENMNKILTAANAQQMDQLLKENPQMVDQLARVQQLKQFIPGFDPNLYQATGATTASTRARAALERRPEQIPEVEKQTIASQIAIKNRAAELFPSSSSSYVFAGRQLDRTAAALSTLVNSADDDIQRLSSQFVKTGAQDLGAQIRARYTSRREATRQSFDTQYDALDAEASSKNVNLKPAQTESIYNFVNSNKQVFEQNPQLFKLVDDAFAPQKVESISMLGPDGLPMTENKPAFGSTSFKDVRSLYRQINKDLYAADLANSQGVPGAGRQAMLLGDLKGQVKAQIDSLPEDIRDKFYGLNAAYDRDYREVFKRGLGGLLGAETRLGVRVKDEDVIDKLVKPSNVDDFFKIFGDNDETQEYLKAGLIDKFLKSPSSLNADGTVNQTALRTFMRTNDGVVRKIPALQDFLSNTEGALATHLAKKNAALEGEQALERSALRAITKRQDLEKVFATTQAGAFEDMNRLAAITAAAKADPTGRSLRGMQGIMLDRAINSADPVKFFQDNKLAFTRAFGKEQFNQASQLVEAAQLLTRKLNVSPPIQILEGDVLQQMIGTSATGVMSTIRRPIVSAPQKAAILFSRFFQQKGAEAKDNAWINLFKDTDAAKEALKQVKILNTDAASDKAKDIAAGVLNTVMGRVGVNIYRAGVVTGMAESRPEQVLPEEEDFFSDLTPVR